MSEVAPDPVAEELALRDLVARYADAVSRQDSAAVGECFAPDGVWQVGGYGEPQGRMTIIPPEKTDDGKITIGGLDANVWMT